MDVEFPEEYYCFQGAPRQIVKANQYTLPENENPRHKVSVASCPDDGSSCTNGKRTNNVNFGSCGAVLYTYILVHIFSSHHLFHSWAYMMFCFCSFIFLQILRTENGKERLITVPSNQLSTWSLDLGSRLDNVTFEFSLYEGFLGYDVPKEFLLSDDCVDDTQSSAEEGLNLYDKVYKSCSHTPTATSGGYRINPQGEEGVSYEVICDFGDLTKDKSVYTTLGVGVGPWTIFQRRFNGKVNFYQKMNSYISGFGTGYYTRNFSPAPINNRNAAFDGMTPASESESDTISGPGASFVRPGSDCHSLLVVENQKISGLYWVDGFGTFEPRQVFCDQVTDGGGWTLIANYGGRDGCVFFGFFFFLGFFFWFFFSSFFFFSNIIYFLTINFFFIFAGI